MPEAEALGSLRKHAGRVFGALGCELLGWRGEADHLQPFAEIPPKHSISLYSVGQCLQKNLEPPAVAAASRHRAALPGWRSLWSPRYFAASTSGVPLEQVKRHHQGQRASAAP